MLNHVRLVDLLFTVPLLTIGFLGLWFYSILCEPQARQANDRVWERVRLERGGTENDTGADSMEP